MSRVREALDITWSYYSLSLSLVPSFPLIFHGAIVCTIEATHDSAMASVSIVCRRHAQSSVLVGKLDTLNREGLW